MIIEKTGNLMDSTALVLGHGVNCKGVMGAGIAAQFRHNWPEMYRQYYVRCLNGDLMPGQAFFWGDGVATIDPIIANIASQDKPGPDAKMEWLESGLHDTLGMMVSFGFRTLALPQIGCGIGGLKWEEVKPMIEDIALAYPSIAIELWTYAAEPAE